MIDVDGPATAASVWEVLRRALGEGNAPLLVFLGGHGLPGETPIDNTLGLWASSSVSAGELASLLGESARPTHLVVTTCYSGGFAEIAFREGAAELGAAPHPHCGLFAAPWDLEASGCDPDPDRARQEGYAIHFFNALAGRDRDKKALDRASLDLDDDGRISLLEAHTRVRIASAGPDVPTTTSERWLRQALAGDPPPAGDAPDVSLPEEAAVVAALGESLGLAGHEADARAKYQHLEDTITVLDERLRQAQAAEDLAFAQAAADILARWPVLDDPWHPEFRATLDANETALARHFAESESYVAYLAAREAVDRLDRELADRRTAAAPLERLVRALETVALARALARRGGPAWDRYQALLACERWIPPVRGHSR
jgi:hypothetical protein